jgi:hypothetical protein
MRTHIASIGLLFSCMTTAAFCQNAKPAEPVVNNTVASCSTLGDPNNKASDEDCAKRDTARLFLMAGKPEAALRVLCNTNAAMSAFRPNGVLDNDKSYTGLGSCLKAVGLGRPEAGAH